MKCTVKYNPFQVILRLFPRAPALVLERLLYGAVAMHRFTAPAGFLFFWFAKSFSDVQTSCANFKYCVSEKLQTAVSMSERAHVESSLSQKDLYFHKKMLQ